MAHFLRFVIALYFVHYSEKASNNPKTAVLMPKRCSSTATGPRTQHGKTMSSRNALKHGILAKTVVLRSIESGETQEEFNSLLDELCDDLKPDGRLEQMFVEKIAVCYWRLRRVLKSESGVLDEDTVMLKTRTLQKRDIAFCADRHSQISNLLRLRAGVLILKPYRSLKIKTFRFATDFGTAP
jgi:hypothetical protein